MSAQISVLTPSFNYDRFILDCLDSVHYQSLPAHEHLIIDDGSTDESVARIRSHVGNQKLTVQSNAGLSATLNRLLDQSTGDWIGWLNADDFYLEGAFAKVNEIIERRPQVDLIIGDTLFVGESGNILRLLPSHRLSSKVTHHYGMTVAPSSFFVRAEMLRSVRFREDTKFLMDKWLFSDLIERNVVSRYEPVLFGAMRRHDEQVSALSRDEDGDKERSEFREAHGLPSTGRSLQASRFFGRLLHMSHKVGSSGYVRQVSMRRNVGTDVRWWLGTENSDT